MTGEVLMFDQKEAPKVVMLDESIEANFYLEESKRRQAEFESEDEESEASDDFNNEQIIEEILKKMNPEEEAEKLKDNKEKVNLDSYFSSRNRSNSGGLLITN